MTHGPRALCIGGAKVDQVLRLRSPLVPEASNRVRASSCAGGVARNVAQNLAALGLGVDLLTAVGTDPASEALLSETRAVGVGTSRVLRREGMAAGSYTAILTPEGDLAAGFADSAGTGTLSRLEYEHVQFLA